MRTWRRASRPHRRRRPRRRTRLPPRHAGWPRPRVPPRPPPRRAARSRSDAPPAPAADAARAPAADASLSAPCRGGRLPPRAPSPAPRRARARLGSSSPAFRLSPARRRGLGAPVRGDDDSPPLEHQAAWPARAQGTRRRRAARRGRSPAGPLPLGRPPAPTLFHTDREASISNDEASARLIALNMALNGNTREEAASYLAEHFELEDPDALLDDVFARATMTAPPASSTSSRRARPSSRTCAASSA